jgi:hypothetical protein
MATNNNATPGGAKRLNLVLDENSMTKLDKIKLKHGDPSYTQAIKRAIALLEFIDEQKEEGMDLFLKSKKKGELQQVITTP